MKQICENCQLPLQVEDVTHIPSGKGYSPIITYECLTCKTSTKRYSYVNPRKPFSKQRYFEEVTRLSSLYDEENSDYAKD